ncbi:MAG: hypothetical protein AAGJ35_08180, partial [Myxococcota bacterium]
DQGVRPVAYANSVNKANQRLPVTENLSVPIRSFFLLILLFCILAGPLNFWVASKRKQRIAILWTVPLLALITSMGIFLYAMWSEGWSGYERSKVFALLDQGHQRALVFGWHGFYAPWPPRDGLHYDRATLLQPQFEFTRERQSSMRWDRDQHLQPGWILSRIPLHFRLKKTETRRERMLFSRKNGHVYVSNGLGKTVERLWFADRARRVYVGAEIQAGQTVRLKRTSKIAFAQKNRMRQVFTEHNWEQISTPLTTTPEAFLERRSYIAGLRQPMFLKPTSSMRYQKHTTIVYGRLERQMPSSTSPSRMPRESSQRQAPISASPLKMPRESSNKASKPDRRRRKPSQTGRSER